MMTMERNLTDGTDNALPLILCIEDDPETAELIQEELDDRGFDVVVQHDGQAGLAAILDRNPALVISDVNMPSMSGFDLLERLHGLNAYVSDVPFVFVTAFGDRESELRGRQLGADDYISKPIDFDILECVIRNRLARKSPTPSGFSDVHLTEREAETLTWSSRGKTSEEIAHILCMRKRTVDFHIDNARTKLGVATRIQAVVEAIKLQLIRP